MNGIGGLRSFLGLLGPDALETERAWVSPPALSETTMRKSLLVDATYAPAGSDRFGPRTRGDVLSEGLDDFSDMGRYDDWLGENIEGVYRILSERSE